MTAMALKDKLTEGEMEVVMSVFRQYETGLREACIDVKVIVSLIFNQQKDSFVFLSRIFFLLWCLLA